MGFALGGYSGRRTAARERSIGRQLLAARAAASRFPNRNEVRGRLLTLGSLFRGRQAEVGRIDGLDRDASAVFVFLELALFFSYSFILASFGSCKLFLTLLKLGI